MHPTHHRSAPMARRCRHEDRRQGWRSVVVSATAVLIGVLAASCTDDEPRVVGQETTAPGDENTGPPVESGVSVGGELPEGFADVVPLPDDYSVELSRTAETDAGQEWSVFLEVEAPAVDAFEELAARFDDAGWEELSKATTPVGETTTSSARYQNDRQSVTVDVTTNPDTGGASIAYSVAPRATT